MFGLDALSASQTVFFDKVFCHRSERLKGSVRIKTLQKTGRFKMITMLVTINISKGWDTWSEMAKGLEPQMNEVGSKIIWAGCNADETAVYVLVEAQDPSFMKTFGERADIVAIREAAGADVSSTTPIAQIGNYFMG